MLDVIYPVKKQGSHKELRYSLRSLANIEHGNVFITGYKPKWVDNVIGLERDQRRHSKWQNSFYNVKLALEHPEVAEKAIIMMDDVYFVKAIEEILYYRGLKVGEIPWMKESQNYFKLSKKLGCRTSWSYEFHIPFVVETAKLLELFKFIEQEAEGDLSDVYWRSLYGNLNRVKSSLMNDVKTWENFCLSDGQVFLSSSDKTFKDSVQPYLLELFPKMCLYEK